MGGAHNKFWIFRGIVKVLSQHKSAMAQPILAAKNGTPRPLLFAKNGPLLPKLVLAGPNLATKISPGGDRFGLLQMSFAILTSEKATRCLTHSTWRTTC